LYEFFTYLTNNKELAEGQQVSCISMQAFMNYNWEEFKRLEPLDDCLKDLVIKLFVIDRNHQQLAVQALNVNLCFVILYSKST